MNFLSLLSVTSLVIAAVFSCKGAQDVDVGTSKDFAAKANGKNFAIITTHLQSRDHVEKAKSDIANWNNTLNLGLLGKFHVNSIPLSTKSDIIQAFDQIASQLESESTVLFVYSGQMNGSELKVSDGSVDFYNDLLTSKRFKKSFARFFFMHDTFADGAKSSFVFSESKKSSLTNIFSQGVELTASSPSSAVVDGRFAAEFSRALYDEKIRPSRITIKGFFDKVMRASGKQNPDSGYFMVGESFLSESLTSSLPRVDDLKPGASASVVMQSANLASGLDFLSMLFGPLLGGGGILGGGGNNNGGGGNINDGQDNNPVQPVTPNNNNNNNNNGNNVATNAKYILIEASLSYCPPCHAMAKEIADDPDYNGTNNSVCTVQTYVTDGDLDRFSQSVPPFTMKHTSLKSAEELKSRYPEFAFQSFPVAFLTDAKTGDVVPTSGKASGGYPACPSSSSR